MQQEIFERMCAKQVECTKQIIKASQETLRALRILKYNGKVINKRIEKLFPQIEHITISLRFPNNEPAIWIYNHNCSYPDKLHPDKFGHTTCSYIDYREEYFSLGTTADENGNSRLDIEETEKLFAIVQARLQQRIEEYSTAPQESIKAREEYQAIRAQIEAWQKKYSYIAREGLKLSYY